MTLLEEIGDAVSEIIRNQSGEFTAGSIARDLQTARLDLVERICADYGVTHDTAMVALTNRIEAIMKANLASPTEILQELARRVAAPKGD